MAIEIELPDGTILEAPDGSDPSAVAKAYMAKQQPQGPPADYKPKLDRWGAFKDTLAYTGKDLGRQFALTGRAAVEGAYDLISPATNAIAGTMNLGLQAVGNDYRFPEQSQAFSQFLTQVGVPEPETSSERMGNIGGRLVTGVMAGAGPISNAISSRFTPAAAQMPRASTNAAQVLQDAGVPLDRSQRLGGRFRQMLRSAVTDHPLTAGRQAEFSEAQQRAFTRAVLRSVGAKADEATQDVMLAAKNRIGSVFDDIGKQGAMFDDALQTDLARIIGEARRTAVESDLAPLLKNVDDILNSVDDTGIINGEKFTRIRSLLSKLSKHPGIGQSADELEDALLGALERSHPGQKAALQDAVDQYRNLKIIEGAIGKGSERYISPRLLANAIATTRNRAMSIYGQGGDQGLVELAQAGRSVLPEVLPNSGTNPRGLMNAPLRAIATAPLYRAGQNYLLEQYPRASNALRGALLPSVGTANAIIEPVR